MKSLVKKAVYKFCNTYLREISKRNLANIYSLGEIACCFNIATTILLGLEKMCEDTKESITKFLENFPDVIEELLEMNETPEKVVKSALSFVNALVGLSLFAIETFDSEDELENAEIVFNFSINPDSETDEKNAQSLPREENKYDA